MVDTAESDFSKMDHLKSAVHSISDAFGVSASDALDVLDWGITMRYMNMPHDEQTELIEEMRKNVESKQKN